MKKVISYILLILFSFVQFIEYTDAYVSVKWYYKKNWTYVAPYVRSNPNWLRYDNYWYKPSQWLYNESYWTKWAEWDTPTYITDDDYYEWLDIYNNLNNESEYWKSYKYIENWYYLNSILYCDIWYKEVWESCLKEKTKNELCNEKYNWTIYRISDDRCICPWEYPDLWDQNTKSCYIPKKENKTTNIKPKNCWINQYYSYISNTCVCNVWYRKNNRVCTKK